MPLIQGKSKEAFKSNLKAELNVGKPMNQGLAIAYAMKRRNAMKKAKGGMIENEEMYPMNEPEHGAKDAVLKELDLSHEDENADFTGAEPTEPEEHVYAADEDKPEFMAKGGMIHKIMMKRKMAAGGEVDSDQAMPDSSDNAYKGTGPLVNRRTKEEMNQQMASRMGQTKPYAEGGYVDDMGMNDQELDPDRFLAEHMPNQDEGRHVSALDDTDSEMAHQKKSKLLAKILHGVRARHMGA